jgi:hypothetical protein
MRARGHSRSEENIIPRQSLHGLPVDPGTPAGIPCFQNPEVSILICLNLDG